ncbi:hypothetical protein [Roseovarius spongiae]|nr:hypothetical protein [Roseovarius spongiae]
MINTIGLSGIALPVDMFGSGGSLLPAVLFAALAARSVSMGAGH